MSDLHPFGNTLSDNEFMTPEKDMIRKKGNSWQVLNHDGTKVEGTHPDRESAVKQLQAIEISKHAGEPGATKPRVKNKK